MSISRRGLLAAGLALTATGAVGITSMLDASAAQVAEPVAAVRSARTPPPSLPRAGRPAGAADPARSAGSRALAVGGTAPTPVYAPKGLPSVGVANRVAAQAQTLALAAPAYTYVSAEQYAESDGTYATLTMAKPYLEAADSHSLAEIAVRSADGQQTVEVGWTVDRSVNHDDQPHLFVYHWVPGRTTCYNGCGWEQYVPSDPNKVLPKPGDAAPTSGALRFAIQHYLGAWWVSFNEEWIGSFPDSEWGGHFIKAGLTQWFGEVLADGLPSCTDMGNGKAAKKQAAAAFSEINLFGGPPASITMNPPSPYYSVAGATSTGFRYGGPGAC